MELKNNDMCQKAFSFLLDMIYPPRCAVCQEISDDVGICSKCRNAFLIVKHPRCMKCGKELTTYEKYMCLDCHKKRFHYIRGFPLWNYDESIRKSVAGFKYHNKKEFAKYYAASMNEEFGENYKEIGADCFVAVPIHSSRLKMRGYNQAQVLAKELSKLTNIPVLDNFLVRNRKTLPQKELSDIERLKNLNQAFQTKNIDDIMENNHIETVILVDDIYTTGSTIEACTLAMLNAGIKRVYYTSICIGKGYV